MPFPLLSTPNLGSVPAMSQNMQDFVKGQITDARSHSDAAFTAAQNAINQLATTKLPDQLADPPTPPSLATFNDLNATLAGLVANFGGLPNFPAISQQIPAGDYTPENIIIPDIIGQVSTLQGVINDMLATGTGIPAEIETEIWERDADRLNKEADKAFDEAANKWAARGFILPPGALVAAAIVVRSDTDGKIAAQSRDVAIKQADLVQKNRQFAVDAGIKLAETEANIILKEVEAAIARARLRLDYLLGALQRASEIAKLELGRIQALAEVFDTSLKRDVAVVNAQAQLAQVRLAGIVEPAKVEVSLYQANAQVWATRVTQVIEASKLLLEAIKSVGQLSATIFAGAAAGTSLSAGVQAGINRGENTSQSVSDSHVDGTNTNWSNSVSNNTNTNISVGG